MKKIGILIQARSASTRLPGKIYLDIKGKSILERCYDACCKAALSISTEGHTVIVSVIGPENDQELIDYCAKQKISFFGGSENDLCQRYWDAAQNFELDYIVRITADCPLIQEILISQCVRKIIEVNDDYISNTVYRTYPDGLDVQVCSIRFMKYIYETQQRDREHPFFIIDTNNHEREMAAIKDLKIGFMIDNTNPAMLKLSIDTQEDLERAKEWISKYGNELVTL